MDASAASAVMLSLATARLLTVEKRWPKKAQNIALNLDMVILR
jgi:hypothetical protein